jgi:hypothetical protein
MKMLNNRNAVSGFNYKAQGRKINEALKRALPSCIGFFIILIFLSLQSCVVYEPVPEYATYPVSSYEIAWESALGAAEDIGIRITSVDEASGTIAGQMDHTTVNILVERLSDRRIRTKVSFRGPSQRSYIANEFHRAFERRMAGR